MNVSCDLCGGTDFYNEAGFYYCSECQRQTQDIQERVFEEAADLTNIKKTKRVKTKTKQTKEQLTSWECYNYVLLGLVNELVELGANVNLKQTVEVLWFKYLKILEVVGKPNEPPKLSAINSKIDAEIIYGRKTPKRKRVRDRSSSPSATEVSTLDAQSFRKEKTRRKKALVKSQYDEFVSTQTSDTSLLNQSLSGLQSTSDATTKNPDNFLQYNRYAAKELRRVMNKTHFKEHKRDVHSKLNCHNISIRTLNSTYVHSTKLLQRSKIYTILYLGLLITKDAIHLGDMLRYIREGHLSYDHVNQFFPEDFEPEQLNIRSFTSGNSSLTHYGMRLTTAKMAVMLKVTKYLPQVNFVELCRRYCKEMNLPDEICRYVLNLISRTSPKMKVNSKVKIIPNYEGRAISFVLFAIKLFFCLDDATEFNFSKFATTINTNLLNKHSYFNMKMFDFELWLKHILYRRLVLSENHFPSKYLRENFSQSDLFVDFMNKYNEKNDLNVDLDINMDLVKTLLNKIDNTKLNYDLHFVHSLTPFHDYLDILLTSNVPDDKNYSMHLLEIDFTKTTLDFLVHTPLYLNTLNRDVTIKYKASGIKDEFKFVYMYDKTALQMKNLRHETQKFNVTFCDNEAENTFNFASTEKRYPKYRKDSEIILKNFEERNASLSNKIFAKIDKSCKKIAENVGQIECSVDVDAFVYDPSQRYWLNTNTNAKMSKKEFNEFFEELPLTLRMVLKECARVTEQTEKDIYDEFCLLEVYLCYVANLTGQTFKKENIVDHELNKFVQKAVNSW